VQNAQALYSEKAITCVLPSPMQNAPGVLLVKTNRMRATFSREERPRRSSGKK
jgi:hypothetical protein